MINKTPQFDTEAERIMWDMIALESSLLTPEKNKYQELLFNGGLVLVDVDNSGDYMFLTKNDIEEIIRRGRAGGDQLVQLHPAYGTGREMTLGGIKQTFDEIENEDGESIGFSSSAYLAARVFPRFGIKAPAPVIKPEPKHKKAPKKEEKQPEKSALVQQIEADESLSEDGKNELIALADEGDLIYVDINGTPQYLSTQYVEYLIQQGNDPSLEVEILLTADGLNEGAKVNLEDLLDVLERSDAFEAATAAQEDQPNAAPQEAPVQDDLPESGLPTENVPEPSGLPEDFVPPARLQDLSQRLPKVSGLLPGGGNIQAEHQVGATFEGSEQGNVGLTQAGPRAVLVEGTQHKKEGGNDMSFNGVKAPEMPRSSAPGQQQSSSDPADNMPADKDALQDSAEKQQENINNQLQQAAQEEEQEEEEEKNKGKYKGQEGTEAKEKFLTAGKVGAAGGLGALGGTLGAAAAGDALAHYDTIMSLISIFV